MLIRDWMATNVISVTEDVSMMKAARLLKEHNISRLPVLDGAGRLIGIVSDRDIKEASPSKATTLDMHELYYLLSEIKVKDIMTRNPISTTGDDTIEHAALLMVEKNVGGLPVVDGNAQVVGMITDSDIFKVLINITGVAHGGLQLAFRLPFTKGSMSKVMDALREHNIRIMSVLSSQKDEDSRMVYIRVKLLGPDTEQDVVAHMRERFDLVYWHSASAAE